MCKKIINSLKENKFLLLAITIACILIFGIFILKIVPFGLIQDQIVQYELFYDKWLEMVTNFFKQGKLPFYSWDSFLGTDFFVSKSYYVTGDIFLPLLLISPFSIRITLMFETIICIYIAGYSMSIFLKKFSIKNANVRQLIGFCYGLSGISMLYFSNFMFMRFYAFLPLLFLGVEKYLQDKKLSFFSLIVAILFLQSYYFMFPTSIFLILYFFLSCLYKERISFLNILKKSLPLILAYFIGFLLSAVLLIPTINMMLQHPRVGAETSGIFFSFKVMLGFLYSHITAPFTIYGKIPHIFVSGYNGHELWYSIYAGVFVFICAMQQIFFDDNKRRKKIFSIGYLILLIFIFIKPLNSIMHGFSEASFRWMFLTIFYICLLASLALDNNLYNKDKMKLSYGIYSIIIIVGTIIGFMMGFIDIKVHHIHLSFSFSALVLGWLYIYLYQKNKFKILAILTFIEIIICAWMFCYAQSNMAYNYNQIIKGEILDYYQDNDEDLGYRQYISYRHLQPNTLLNLNQSLVLDYMSVAMYDSTYEINLSEFLRANGFENHIVDITDPDLLKMLGVKYTVVYDESELDNVSNYEYVYNIDYLKVYKLKDYNHLGYTFNKTIVNDKNDDWSNVLIVPDKWKDLDFSKSLKTQFIVSEIGNNTLKGNISVNSDSVLFLSVPYNKGWKIFDNGELVEFEKVQLGFIGLLLDEGDHYIEMYYMPQGFKLGLGLSVVGAVLLGTLVIYDVRRKKNSEVIK
ncbi:MAG: YfhO family protein [Anaerorhabdus sp.]